MCLTRSSQRSTPQCEWVKWSFPLASLPAAIRLIALLTGIFGCPVDALQAASFDAVVSSVTAEELRQHVSVLASDTFEGREAGSPGGRAAGVYLAEALQQTAVAPAGDNGTFFQEFGANYRNILAVLPGSDPQLRGECILVSAHYDHVGYGTARNSYGPIGYIHNGADDNASGTAALLEVVQAIAELEPRPRRSILFALWDAEEKGLLGSSQWVSRPTVPLGQVRLMINLDMVGRLRDNRVQVYGTRTAPGLRKLVALQNEHADLHLDFDWSMIRESDHYTFYLQSVPCLMLHTDKHEDYHRPSDDIERVNYEGAQSVSRFLLRLVCAAADAERLPAFRSEIHSESTTLKSQLETPLPPLPPRLGAAWNAELADDGIVQLTQVTPGSPADRGGLRVGDRIVRFGALAVDDAGDFRRLVHTAENRVTAIIERSGANEPIPLTIELAGQPVQFGISWRIDPGEPEAVIVCRVVPGAPADRAGLRAGDRIYRINGDDFPATRFQERLANAGDSPVLMIEREGKLREIRAAHRRAAGVSRPVHQRAPGR